MQLVGKPDISTEWKPLLSSLRKT